MKSKMSLQNNGTFQITNVDQLSYTYFPLCNTLSMKSVITPSFGGDLKAGQNRFLLLPNSIEDLSNSLLKRNVFFRVNDSFTWSVTGQTPKQILTPDQVDLYGGFLIHKIVRSNQLFTCEIESFVPANDTYQELHRITVKNITKDPLSLQTVVGVPIYGRSADNIRDHRHVTSLLNRVMICENGLINKPTFSFDERGHIENQTSYGVFASTSLQQKVKEYYPTLEEFVGEGGSMLDPLVVKESTNNAHQIGDVISGYEAIAGIKYDSIVLQEGEELSIVLSLIIDEDTDSMKRVASELSLETFDQLKQETKQYWEHELSSLAFHYPDETFNGWLKWVTFQPTLRRLYGNSFMPHHDYGRGGRGWRDLWQDLLALILMDPNSVKEMLSNNFKGVRIDGSNATIIGDNPGEFLADRNQIARVWMDHGSWPLITTKLYLDHSGDTSLLFEKVEYFQDQFTHYTKQVNKEFTQKNNKLQTHSNETYYGTIFEHLLIQNVVPYYNVGKHNNIRLEDADWNDGLDMAHHKGESVAFTSFYGANLILLAELLQKLHDQGIKELSLFEECSSLLVEVDQHNISLKNEILSKYFESVKQGISGETVVYDTLVLKDILEKKGQDLLQQVRDNEWLEDEEDGWFNGYYDDESLPLDDIKKKDMTLTGQVFSIMSHAATKEQVKKIVKSADRYLYREDIGGYRLNTDFNEVKTNMGRLFGFAYGHKENGAMFSHMTVMYANALYKRGFVKEGHKVINAIYKHSIDLPNAKIYPGLPEYFDPKGRGMYHYLTGSASWMILTLVTEVFGIKGDLGLPVFEPKLLLSEFGKQNKVMIDTLIDDTLCHITYENTDHLEFGSYEIVQVLVDGKETSFTKTEFGVKLTQKLSGKDVRIVLKEKR